jgi:formamidopyrimidine-DNA glycosylase
VAEAEIRRPGRAVKLLLLDQRVVAGLGNIYACEALFRAGSIRASQPAKVSRAKLDGLAQAIPDVLEEAISAGGSTLRDFAAPDGELGYFAKQFDVYDREGSSHADMREQGQTDRAGRPIDLLLPLLPAMKTNAMGTGPMLLSWGSPG